MKIPEVEPVLVREDKFGKEYEHPSWGVVNVSRVSGSADLFGSNLNHYHFVTLSIGRAGKNVDDNGFERVTGRSIRGELVEVAMSEAQWAQLLSSMNMGSGVPCTIQYVGKERMPACPANEVKEHFQEAIREDVKQMGAELLQFEKQLTARFSEDRPIGKAERKELLGKVSMLVRGLTDKLPFIQEMLNEKLEQQVAAAKTEIDSFLQFKAQVLGMKAVQQHVAMLSDGSGSRALPAGDPDPET